MPDLSEKPLDVYCYSVPLLKVFIQVWRGTKQHKPTKTKPGHNLPHLNQTCISTFLEQYDYCQQLLLSFRGVLNITVAQYFKKHRLRFKKKKIGSEGEGRVTVLNVEKSVPTEQILPHRTRERGNQHFWSTALSRTDNMHGPFPTHAYSIVGPICKVIIMDQG